MFNLKNLDFNNKYKIQTLVNKLENRFFVQL